MKEGSLQGNPPDTLRLLTSLHKKEKPKKSIKRFYKKNVLLAERSFYTLT